MHRDIPAAGGRHNKKKCCADRRTEIKGSHSFLIDLHSSRRMGCNYIKIYVSLLEGALGHRNFLFEFVSYSETAAREREKGNNPTRRVLFYFFVFSFVTCYLCAKALKCEQLSRKLSNLHDSIFTNCFQLVALFSSLRLPSIAISHSVS